MKTEIPLLADVRVASPCHASWDTMKGDERARFCGLCRKNVYNLSEMTRQEAENLLREKEGRLCVRYYQRADGTVLTKDCPIGAAIVRRALLTRAVSASALLVTVIALFGKNIAGAVFPEDSPHGIMQGGMAPTPRETVGKVVAEPVEIVGSPVTIVPRIRQEPTMGIVAYIPEQHKAKPKKK